MRSLIIVEGPDGAGKTGLVERLKEHLNVETRPRACTSEGGPVDELMRWLKDDLTWLEPQIFSPHSEPAYLYDRYPPFSETAYGPACRGYLNPGFNNPVKFSLALQRLKMLEPTVVWCMPSLKAVVNNVRREGETHMPGVYENIEQIYANYQALMAYWDFGMGTSGGFHTWNYEVHDFPQWLRAFARRAKVTITKEPTE